MPKNTAKVLRDLLKKPEILMAPGVYDGISARVVGQAGFQVAYLSGAGVSATATGQADIGLTTMTETVNAAKVVTTTINIPLICDADTGYGNALNVIRTVHELEIAGAAAIQLEDQLAPKRCGHMSGKTVISTAEFVQKLRAAVNEKYNQETLIVARTDSRAAEGFFEAVERCKRYLDTGIDILFFEAPQSVEEVEQVAKLFARQIPLLSNQVVGGRTPSLTADELQKMGYKIVIFPSTIQYAASVLLAKVAERLMKNRTDNGIIEGGNAMDFFYTMGLQEWKDIESKYK